MNWFSYTLKKSAAFRLLLFLALVCFFVFALRLILKKIFSDKPSIINIYPNVVQANDTVTVSGKHFGNADEGRGIYFDDVFLSAVNCSAWTDTSISFVVPKDFKTCLVSVAVGSEFSEKKLLTNRAEIPQVLQKQVLSSLPEITSISKNSAAIGQRISIYGKHFGASRQNSNVIFTEMPQELLHEKTSELAGAYCHEAEFDFVEWADTEITVHVPDGAVSGNVIVQTSAGISNFIPFRVSATAGKKILSNKRNILISLAASVQNIKPRSAQNTLFLFLPHPMNSYRQDKLVLHSTDAEPFARNFQNSDVYRFENLNETSQLSISESVSIETYDVQVQVNTGNISAQVTLKPEMLKYTKAEPGIPSDTEQVTAVAKKITGGYSNPYSNAKKIFSYMVENIAPVTRSLNDVVDIVHCLETKKADSYECSLIYCTLLRALSIPCIQVSGIIIDKDRTARLHWWNEFYIEGIGWVPVDTALALGMPYHNGQKSSEFFASLDGLHVAFSRGQQARTKMLAESTIVRKTKTYAAQEFWEESAGLAAYNSLWNVPKVLSIYSEF